MNCYLIILLEWVGKFDFRLKLNEMQLKENVCHCAHNEGGKAEPVVHAWPYISAPTGRANVKWQKINQN